MMGFLDEIAADMKAKEIKLEEGDEIAYVLDDAVVLLEMQPGKHLAVKVLAGEPERLAIKTNLLEEE